MSAGLYTERLKLYRPVSVEDSFGSRTEEYQLANVVWAWRLKDRGKRVIDASEIFAAYDVEFRVRSRVEVGEGWQCRTERGGDSDRTYVVANVVNDLHNGYRTLSCITLNP